MNPDLSWHQVVLSELGRSEVQIAPTSGERTSGYVFVRTDE